MPPYLPGKNGAETHESDDDDEIVATWTLRKCSAAGLDKLSTLFGNELLQYVLPVIQQKIQSPLWKERESAVLVLGAISDGCHSGLEPHLDGILQQLLARAADPDPLVRVIACWALSRFAEHVFHPATGENIVRSIFEKILHCMHDKNRQVQQAASSALATMEEFAGPVLLPHLQVPQPRQISNLSCRVDDRPALG